MHRRDRPRFDNLTQRRTLGCPENGAIARCLAIDQPARPFGVEPKHPVPDDLQPHTAHRRRLTTRAAGVDRSQSQ